MADFVLPVRLFVSEWPAARAAWNNADPGLYAVTPDQPVERMMEQTPTAFGALVRTILHQQISIFAGRAITGRLVDACHGVLEPEPVLDLSVSELRQIGLSERKARYVTALAEAARDGLLYGLDALSDDAVIEQLVALPGIGVWTAKMFCLFHLARPDVFSGADFGLREGVRILDGSIEPPTPSAAEARAEIWQPYRSVASVVLWDLVRRTRLEAQNGR